MSIQVYSAKKPSPAKRPTPDLGDAASVKKINQWVASLGLNSTSWTDEAGQLNQQKKIESEFIHGEPITGFDISLDETEPPFAQIAVYPLGNVMVLLSTKIAKDPFAALNKSMAAFSKSYSSGSASQLITGNLNAEFVVATEQLSKLRAFFSAVDELSQSKIVTIYSKGSEEDIS
jgi:hypothetical protein